MKLKEYLEKHEMSQSQFAKLHRIGRDAINRYVNGDKPTPTIAAKIYRATKGKVTFQDMGY